MIRAFFHRKDNEASPYALMGRFDHACFLVGEGSDEVAKLLANNADEAFIGSFDIEGCECLAGVPDAYFQANADEEPNSIAKAVEKKMGVLRFLIVDLSLLVLEKQKEVSALIYSTLGQKKIIIYAPVYCEAKDGLTLLDTFPELKKAEPEGNIDDIAFTAFVDDIAGYETPVAGSLRPDTPEEPLCSLPKKEKLPLPPRVDVLPKIEPKAETKDEEDPKSKEKEKAVEEEQKKPKEEAISHPASSPKKRIASPFIQQTVEERRRDIKEEVPNIFFALVFSVLSTVTALITFVFPNGSTDVFYSLCIIMAFVFAGLAITPFIFVLKDLKGVSVLKRKIHFIVVACVVACFIIVPIVNCLIGNLNGWGDRFIPFACCGFVPLLSAVIAVSIHEIRVALKLPKKEKAPKEKREKPKRVKEKRAPFFAFEETKTGFVKSFKAEVANLGFTLIFVVLSVMTAIITFSFPNGQSDTFYAICLSMSFIFSLLTVVPIYFICKDLKDYSLRNSKVLFVDVLICYGLIIVAGTAITIVGCALAWGDNFTPFIISFWLPVFYLTVFVILREKTKLFRKGK